ncbi:MAG: outer membrane beta-barrel protein [Hyphomicrobium sp.]|nr:outer membrane beta-barrel protein [Hyphomicrobium sp.]
MLFAARAGRAARLSVLAALLLAKTQQLEARADNVLAPIWTGVYVGIHGGGNWTELEAAHLRDNSSDDLTFGGHLGFNIGLGLIVAGVEADLNYEAAEFQSDPLLADFSSGEVKASGTLRGRVGIPIGPALFYATAGYAWTNVDLTYRSGSGVTRSGTDAFDGIVYGLGAEAFVLPNVTLRLEALRFDYESKEISLSGGLHSLEAYDPNSTVVRAGISYRF